MSTNQFASKVEALLEWERIMQEAKEEAEALRDEIKREMMARRTEVFGTRQWVVSWRPG